MRWLALVVLSGCAASSTISLLGHGAPVTLTPAHAIPLEVVTRKNADVPDPLPLRGSLISFGELETALGYAVSTAVAPWAEQHMFQRPEGWQLAIDLISANAEKRGHEVHVTLGVRATLRTRTGNRYLAQTQAHCSRSGRFAPREASVVAFECMARIGRELGGWLGGIQP